MATAICEAIANNLFGNVFENINPVLLEELNRKKHMRIYKKKQVLYYEGNPAIGVFLIKSGRAKVYKIGPEGKQYILRLAKSDDMLGLESLFNNISYFSSTTEMVEEGQVCLIEKQDLLDLIGKDRNIAHNIIKMMAAQVIAGDEERVDLAHRAVRERMARLLFTLGHNYGIKMKEGIRLNLNLSREDIAEMIGTASESVIRLLSEFREEKIIGVQGKDIIIFNESRLAQTAHLER